MREILKYCLKRGWNRKEGSGNKDFEKGEKLDQGVDALKGGAGTPLRTMQTRRLFQKFGWLTKNLSIISS